ncbi:MAG: branched-chain amino acid ABC transporter permease [Bacillota bacterium]
MIGQMIVNGLITGSIFVMMAIGFSIMYNAMRFFNLAHGAIFLSGAYCSFIMHNTFGVGLIGALLLGTVVAAVIHIAVAKVVYFPMRLRGAGHWIVAIASMGIAFIFEAVVGLFIGTRPLSMQKNYLPSMFQFQGIYISSVEIAIVLTSFIVIGLLALFLNRAKFGKAMRATVCDRDMAQVLGINASSIDLLVYSIGTFMAAGAGALMSLQVQLTHTMGHSALFKSIVVSILGISGGFVGTLMGGLFLGFVENCVVYFLNIGWRDGISLLILIVYILLTQIKKREREIC